MSGSGAGVFAEFAAEGEARALQSELPDSMRGFVARGIERHPLYDWAD
jgi:4-diphosphocytidyl-2-C-methyl-D-erythritol kinase